jgi:hypothetical protein
MTEAATTDEGREPAAVSGFEAGVDVRAPEHPKRIEGAIFSLQGQWLHFFGHEVGLEPGQGRLADQDLVAARRGAQPLRRVHGVARQLVAAVQRVAFPDEDHAGVNSGMQLRNEVVRQGSIDGERANGGMKLQGGFDCTTNVVLVGRRISEDREDSIAVELIHGAPVSSDDGFRPVLDRMLERIDVFGIAGLAQRGVVAEIRKQERHVEPLAGYVGATG